MSCSEPGGRKGNGPIRPFGEPAMPGRHVVLYATAMRELYAAHAAAAISGESAMIIEAALREVARNHGIDVELKAILEAGV